MCVTRSRCTSATNQIKPGVTLLQSKISLPTTCILLEVNLKPDFWAFSWPIKNGTNGEKVHWRYCVMVSLTHLISPHLKSNLALKKSKFERKAENSKGSLNPQLNILLLCLTSTIPWFGALKRARLHKNSLKWDNISYSRNPPDGILKKNITERTSYVFFLM